MLRRAATAPSQTKEKPNKEKEKKEPQNPALCTAAARLPKLEIKELVDRFGFCASEARMLVALNRLNNRRCNIAACTNKVEKDDLARCESCLCTWYCSKECMKADVKAHLVWCANPDAAEPDRGPLAFARDYAPPDQQKQKSLEPAAPAYAAADAQAQRAVPMSVDSDDDKTQQRRRPSFCGLNAATTWASGREPGVSVIFFVVPIPLRLTKEDNEETKKSPPPPTGHKQLGVCLWQPALGRWVGLTRGSLMAALPSPATGQILWLDDGDPQSKRVLGRVSPLRFSGSDAVVLELEDWVIEERAWHKSDLS